MTCHAFNNSVVQGREGFPEKVSIMMNDVHDFYWKSSSNLKHKSNLVRIQFQTAHFGIRANQKQAGTSSRKKRVQKLEHIKNNPLAVIVTLLTIYPEAIPLMINVGLINTRALFKNMCTRMPVA